MYWTTLGRALAPCKIPEICEIQICIDIPVLSIWKLISTGLFVSLFGFMYISSSFFHFLPVFSTFFRKKLEEIPFFQFLPFFPEETYFFRKFPNPDRNCTRKRERAWELPDIIGRTALAVRPDVVNAKYHVITNATYNCDPVPAKFKHVTNIDTCTLLCCDYSKLWEALHVNMVEIGARCSDKNVNILG